MVVILTPIVLMVVGTPGYIYFDKMKDVVCIYIAIYKHRYRYRLVFLHHITSYYYIIG